MHSLFFPYDIYPNLVGFHTLVPVIHVVIPSRKGIFVQTWQLCSTVTLKIRSMLPKPNQLLLNNPIFTSKIRSRLHLKIPGRLKRRIRYVHLNKHLRRGKFGSLSAAVTLKIRSRSPKANQLFVSQYYIHANLVKICLSVGGHKSETYFLMSSSSSTNSLMQKLI